MSHDHTAPVASGQAASKIVGQTFGRLTILGDRIDFCGSRRRRILDCECQCGRVVSIRADSILRDRLPTESCGCLSRENLINRTTTHSMSGSPEYRVWRSMKSRCENPRNGQYKDYGGRGIAICDRWVNSFENFLEDMGPRPSLRYSLERTNNSLSYSKSNCVWATKKEQQNNTRQNRVLEFSGRRMNVEQWSDHLGWPRHIIHGRLRRGWSIEDTLTKPPEKSVRLEEFSGVVMRVADWANLLGVAPQTFGNRAKYGHSFQDTISFILKRKRDGGGQ